jgi:hypothetical protein
LIERAALFIHALPKGSMGSPKRITTEPLMAKSLRVKAAKRPMRVDSSSSMMKRPLPDSER